MLHVKTWKLPKHFFVSAWGSACLSFKSRTVGCCWGNFHLIEIGIKGSLIVNAITIQLLLSDGIRNSMPGKKKLSLVWFLLRCLMLERKMQPRCRKWIFRPYLPIFSWWLNSHNLISPQAHLDLESHPAGLQCCLTKRTLFAGRKKMQHLLLESFTTQTAGALVFFFFFHLGMSSLHRKY